MDYVMFNGRKFKFYVNANVSRQKTPNSV